ncbi:MAG: hypothetical protein IPM56_06195 [Ignavibacteriales bacterium]|nr:MAG: hypothetical protein IPM56_06195 [Ignavibacteriales bacterium]
MIDILNGCTKASILNYSNIVLILILIITQAGISQQKSPELREYSFGHAWFNNDTSEFIGLGGKFDKEGVVNANNFFLVKDTNLVVDRVSKMIKSWELEMIWLLNIEAEGLWVDLPFNDSTRKIEKYILITGSTITNIFGFDKLHFVEGVRLFGNNFIGWSQISNCKFENYFGCNSDSFLTSRLSIINSIFNDTVDLSINYYKYGLEIDSSNFESSLILSNTKSEAPIILSDSRIRNLILDKITFNSKPEFARIIIEDTFDISNSKFEKGLDLRRINLDNCNTIFLENIYFDQGELVFYWDQMKGKDSPKIKLKRSTGNSDDDYKIIEEIYKTLAKNFLSQNDKSSADDVLYELAWQKEIILGEFSQWLYGVSFGYGYQPLRYLLFPVFVFIILFFFLWYLFFYNIVAYVQNKEFDADLELIPHYNIKFPSKNKFGLKFIDHMRISPKIPEIAKWLHSIHFSTSVLLGIRFKKDWIRIAAKHKESNNAFLYWVLTEYLIGKILLLIFILAIKVYHFENWKSYLGL